MAIVMFGFWFKTKQNANRHPTEEPEKKQNRKTVFFISQFDVNQGVGTIKKRKETKQVITNLFTHTIFYKLKYYIKIIVKIRC
jgi:hypothetical protein